MDSSVLLSQWEIIDDFSDLRRPFFLQSDQENNTNVFLEDLKPIEDKTPSKASHS